MTPASATVKPPLRLSPRRVMAMIYLLPYVVLLLMFFIAPTVFGLVMSFFDWEMLSGAKPHFVGLDNYAEAFADTRFLHSIKVTFLFVLMTVPSVLLVALVLAASISALPKRQGVYRSAIYIPTLINITVASILWRWFYSTRFGLFNQLLEPFGIAVPWLSSEVFALPSVALMTVWWTSGVSFLILLTAFQQVPDSLYEAAELDGANQWQKFIYIGIPQVRPVLVFCFVIEVIAAFKIFGQTWLMTSGGPEGSTLVAMQYIYETAFSFYRMGYASALSWVFFLIILALVLVGRWARRIGGAGA